MAQVEHPDKTELQKEIESAINRCSAENGSNTPDFILAEYLMDCLDAFDKITDKRDHWYGMAPAPGWRDDTESPRPHPRARR